MKKSFIATSICVLIALNQITEAAAPIALPKPLAMRKRAVSGGALNRYVKDVSKPKIGLTINTDLWPQSPEAHVDCSVVPMDESEDRDNMIPGSLFTSLALNAELGKNNYKIAWQSIRDRMISKNPSAIWEIGGIKTIGEIRSILTHYTDSMQICCKFNGLNDFAQWFKDLNRELIILLENGDSRIDPEICSVEYFRIVYQTFLFFEIQNRAVIKQLDELIAQ